MTPHDTLNRMSPTMKQALLMVHDGYGHELHGREKNSLLARGLIHVDGDTVTLTPHGAAVVEVME